MWKPVVSVAKIEWYSRLNLTQWQLLCCIWNFFVTAFCQISVFFSFPRTCSLPFTIWTRALLMKVKYIPSPLKLLKCLTPTFFLASVTNYFGRDTIAQYFFGWTLYGCFVSVKRETTLIFAKSQRKYFSSWLNSNLGRWITWKFFKSYEFSYLKFYWDIFKCAAIDFPNSIYESPTLPFRMEK